MYKWRGEPLSVYVAPAARRRPSQANEIVERIGHEAVIWSAGGRTYVVVAAAARPSSRRSSDT